MIYIFHRLMERLNLKIEYTKIYFQTLTLKDTQNYEYKLNYKKIIRNIWPLGLREQRKK